MSSAHMCALSEGRSVKYKHRMCPCARVRAWAWREVGRDESRAPRGSREEGKGRGRTEKRDEGRQSGGERCSEVMSKKAK